MSVRARQIAMAFDRKRKESKKRRFRLLPVELDNRKLMRLEELGQELLHGIDNEITLTHIVPRLPWRTLLVLSSVCRDWKRALLSSNRHYHQRVSSGSTETLAVVDINIPDDHSRAFAFPNATGKANAIALYSVRDERLYYVPPVPGFEGFPKSCQCVGVDGKLYVLGGEQLSMPGSRSERASSGEVYVLDLLGTRRWRQCESMRRPRYEFGSAVMDGKIYVFGGENLTGDPVARAEVYDPTIDSWSPVPYSGLCRFNHRVTVVGEEFVLHGGMNYEYPPRNVIPFDHTSLLEFYNPVTKEYRVVDSIYFRGMNIVSGAQGIFHSVRWQDMGAHAVDEHGTLARTHRRPIYAEIPLHRAAYYRNEEPTPIPIIGRPFTLTAIDDELLAVHHWINAKTWIDRSYIVRSRGYSTESSQMSWEEAPCSGKHNSPTINGIKCSIRL